MQLATSKRCYVFKLLAGSDWLNAKMRSHLRGLLENGATAKIVHDAHAAVAVLCIQMGIIVAGIWDTQVPAWSCSLSCSVSLHYSLHHNYRGLGYLLATHARPKP